MQSTGFRWRHYSIRTKTRVAVLLPMGALLVSCGLIGLVSTKEKEADEWVVHTLEVRLALATFERQFSAAETKLRSYVERGTVADQSAAKTSLIQTRESLWKVRNLTSDNPDQQRRINEASLLVDGCLRLTSSSPEGRKQTALRRVEGSLAGQIRDKIAEMDQEEARLLRSRAERTGSLEGVLSILIPGTILLGVLGTLFGTSLLSGNISRRISQLLESIDSHRRGPPSQRS